MKKLLLAFIATAIIFASCDSDDDDKPKYQKQLLTKATVDLYGSLKSQGRDREHWAELNIQYDENDKIDLATIKMWDDYSINPVYNDKGDLIKVELPGDDDIEVPELLSGALSLTEHFTEIEYDDNMNPSKVVAVYTEEEENDTLTMELTYDDKAFFLYGTIEAAGLLPVLSAPLSSSLPDDAIVDKLDRLMPVNNPTSVVIKINGEKLVDAYIDYNYNEKNHPTSGDVEVVLWYYDDEEDDWDSDTILAKFNAEYK